MAQVFFTVSGNNNYTKLLKKYSEQIKIQQPRVNIFGKQNLVGTM